MHYIYIMPKLLSLIAFCLLTISMVGQTSFSVDSTLVTSTYPDDTPVFYPWIELTNNTGSLLEMRCVKVSDQKPATWETRYEDLDSAYGHVPDSATFFLPAVNQQAQFIIVSFHPNNTVGRATVKLKLYPANDPADSVILTYIGNAYAVPIDTTTGITKQSDWLPMVSLYPQPSNHTLRISADKLGEVQHLFLVDIQGHKVPVNWTLVNSTNIEVSLANKAAGTYLLVLQDAKGNSFTKIIAKQ